MKIKVDYYMINMAAITTSSDLFAESKDLARSLDSADKPRNVEVKVFSRVGPVP